MTSAPLDVSKCRQRFSALSGSTAFLDGAGGSQTPDEVIRAIATYLLESNANDGGEFPTSRRTGLVIDEARASAARFLGCGLEEAILGATSTSTNFALTRVLARELEAGDEVLVTKLDHDANIAPWLELQRDVGIVVRFVELDDQLRIDLDDLANKRTTRTRVVACSAASNSVGTTSDVKQIAQLAHEAGALAWVDAVHLAPHAPIDFDGWDADVVLCSSYKAFGPHMAIAAVRASLLESWRGYQARPAPDRPLAHRHEQGTGQHELFAGLTAAISYIESIGWDAVRGHEQLLGDRFLDMAPPGIEVFGPRTMEGRVPTFAFLVPGLAPAEVARRLAADHKIAVWSGNHYALELARHIGVDGQGGTVRASFVHYNTIDEVDRLLAALDTLAGLRG